MPWFRSPRYTIRAHSRQVGQEPETIGEQLAQIRKRSLTHGQQNQVKLIQTIVDLRAELAAKDQRIQQLEHTVRMMGIAHEERAATLAGQLQAATDQLEGLGRDLFGNAPAVALTNGFAADLSLLVGRQ